MCCRPTKLTAKNIVNIVVLETKYWEVNKKRSNEEIRIAKARFIRPQPQGWPVHLFCKRWQPRDHARPLPV